MMIHKQNLKNKIVAMAVAILMVFTLIPSSALVYADTVYDYQPPNAEENGMQSVKLLEPSDISVIEETDEYILNRINTPIDGTEDIEFSLSMTSGMNNFTESNFLTNNMPVIKIYDEEGEVAAEYSDGAGDLKFIGSEITDEINNQGGQKTRAVFIGVEQGVLDNGTYILEFGKDLCGNNTAKKLGINVRFEFAVKAYPPLDEMIKEAEAFLESINIGTSVGEYPQDAVDVFKSAIDTAKNDRDKINSLLEEGAIDAYDAELQKNTASEILYNALLVLKSARNVVFSGITVTGISGQQIVGDSGRAEADIIVEPDENQYKKVRWEASDNILIDKSSGKWIAVYAGEGWVRAVSTHNDQVYETVDVKVVNEEGSASFTYGIDATLEQVLGEDAASTTSLKLYAANKYVFTKKDIEEIRALVPGLKQLDMENIPLDNIGSNWFEGWTSLEKVVLPENLETIGTKAFYECTALKEIFIPAPVKKIGNAAFAGCTSLNSTITVMAANPPEFMEINENWGLGDPFNGLSSDEPASVTTFQVPYDSKVDYENTDIWNRYKFVEMDEKVLTVNFNELGGLEAAAEAELAAKGWNDDQVTELIIKSPEGIYMQKATDIKYLQNNFLGASTIDLRGTAFNDNNLQASTFEGRRNMKVIELPSNITHIGKKVFYGCSNLRSLTVPEGVHYVNEKNPGIGESSLAGCDKLTTLVMLPLDPPGYAGSLPTGLTAIYVPNLAVAAYKEAYSDQASIIKPLVSVTLSDISVEAMNEIQLEAIVDSAVPVDDKLHWEITTSQDKDNPVAVINEETGILTACRYGAVKVKVTAGYGTMNECSDTCTVTVTKAPSVTLTTTRASYNSIKLSWSAMENAEGYQIFRSTSETGEYSLHKTVTSSEKTFTDTGLTTGKTYYYKVRGYKTVNGVKVHSEYSEVKSAKPYLTTPTVTAKRNSYNSNKVTWNGISGATGYKVYRATSKSGKYSLIATKGKDVRSYVDTKRITGTTYYYKVRAYRTINNSPVYSAYSAVKSATPSLSKVVAVKTVKAGTQKIKVTWGNVPGATGYKVYRSTKKTSGFKVVKTVKAGKTRVYTSGKLIKNKKYYFKVRAYRVVNGKTVYGPYSNVVYRTAK